MCTHCKIAIHFVLAGKWILLKVHYTVGVSLGDFGPYRHTFQQTSFGLCLDLCVYVHVSCLTPFVIGRHLLTQADSYQCT